MKLSSVKISSRIIGYSASKFLRLSNVSIDTTK